MTDPGMGQYSRTICQAASDDGAHLFPVDIRSLRVESHLSPQCKGSVKTLAPHVSSSLF